MRIVNLSEISRFRRQVSGMEVHQPIADSSTGFGDTPKRSFCEFVKSSMDNSQKCDDFATPSKRARTLGSDSGSHHAEESSGNLDQCDKSISFNHGMLDTLNYDKSIFDGSLHKCTRSGWAVEDNSNRTFSLFEKSLTNNDAGFNPITGPPAGATSELIDLILTDTEGYDEASLCSDSEQHCDRDSELIFIRNSSNRPLSTPSGVFPESKPISDEKSNEIIYDTCFGFASPTPHSCMICTHISDRSAFAIML